MRVIAGSARRLQLKCLDTLETRPTTDRIKETLFNILSPEIPGACFLDLFAGSGGIGIEALSRGAKKAVFVENNARAMDCIRDNLARTHLAGRAVTMRLDALYALKKLEGRECFDIIFLDPPYGKGLEEPVIRYLSSSALLNPDTTVIIEAAKDTGYEWTESLGFTVYREKVYKTNKHVFLNRTE